MRRKYLVLGLGLIMAMSMMTACGSKKDDKTTEATTIATTEEATTEAVTTEEVTTEAATTEINTALEYTTSNKSLNVNVYPTLEANDTSLEFPKGSTVFKCIDFAKATDIYPDVNIAKRSTSNVCLEINTSVSEKTYSIQYSTGYGNYSDETVRSTLFENGYETVTLADGHEALVNIRYEDDMYKVLIMQEVGDDNYVSIRAANKTEMSNTEFAMSLIIGEEYPIYTLPSATEE